jgi:hypothetical protein
VPGGVAGQTSHLLQLQLQLLLLMVLLVRRLRSALLLLLLRACQPKAQRHQFYPRGNLCAHADCLVLPRTVTT